MRRTPAVFRVIASSVCLRFPGCSWKLSRNSRKRGMSGQDGCDVANGEIGHCSPGFDRSAAQMRDQHDVVERKELGFDLRLVFEDIEPGAGDQPRAQRPGKRL